MHGASVYLMLARASGATAAYDLGQRADIYAHIINKLMDKPDQVVDASLLWGIMASKATNTDKAAHEWLQR